MTDGFLGTGAPFSADLNLLMQLAMGATLIVGWRLARGKRYGAHQVVQTTVMLLNLVMIVLIMVPSLHKQVPSDPAAALSDAHTRVAYVHALLGAVAETLGIYIILVAGTSLVPRRLRFKNYKPWMRTTLVLWWVVILFGAGTYYTWYLRPAVLPAKPTGGRAAVNSARIVIANFAFAPKVLTIPVGTTVVWSDSVGRHRLVPEDGTLFEPHVLTAGMDFVYRFDRPGRFAFYCSFHGDIGGVDMSGVVIVSARSP